MMRCAAWINSHLAVALSAVVFAAPTQAVILYVDDSTGPGGSGLSWSSPMRFLQDALAYAADPSHQVTTIRVGKGTYRTDQTELTPQGTGDLNATFQLINGVRLEGGYGGTTAADPDVRNPLVNVSKLDGNLMDGPLASYHVVSAISVDVSAVLDGFRVAWGDAFGSGPGQSSGGGMTIVNGSPTILNCYFSRNDALQDGGGISIVNGAPQIINCTFYENSALRGGGINNENSSAPVQLINCTMVANEAIMGSALRTVGTPTVVANGIFWDNIAGPTIDGPTSVSYSCVQGGWPGVGNIGTDPMLAWLVAEYNFALLVNSPCIDKGSSGALPRSITTDAYIQARFVDSPTSPDCPLPGTDCGAGAAVDMGAAEYQLGLAAFGGDTTLEGGWYEFEQYQPHGPMTPVLADVPDFTSITEIATPLGPLQLDTPHYKLSVAGGAFPAWSHGGAVGDEIFIPQDSWYHYTLPPGAGAFDMYIGKLGGAGLAQITGFSSTGEEMTVFKTITSSVTPGGGPSHVGFFVTEPGVTLHSVVVQAEGPVVVAEFRVGSIQLPADLDGDGVVNGFDLALLLGAWGSCPTRDAACPADLDGNDVVNGFDLAMLLSAWG